MPCRGSRWISHEDGHLIHLSHASVSNHMRIPAITAAMEIFCLESSNMNFVTTDGQNSNEKTCFVPSKSTERVEVAKGMAIRGSHLRLSLCVTSSPVIPSVGADTRHKKQKLCKFRMWEKLHGVQRRAKIWGTACG